ncbi:hypothetical protein B0O99DRAFT_689405 [Bisporella sp. PMI_857]|nr:hypothetical protein B0O99DRAFT_689405 [Bisporella sp. PMI_857]
MATNNEKLCMAIINNSKVMEIDWVGVGRELGVTANAADCRWRRYKKSIQPSTPSKDGKTESFSGTPSKKRSLKVNGDGSSEGEGQNGSSVKGTTMKKESLLRKGRARKLARTATLVGSFVGTEDNENDDDWRTKVLGKEEDEDGETTDEYVDDGA